MREKENKQRKIRMEGRILRKFNIEKINQETKK
jgi:hypothetical protein